MTSVLLELKFKIMSKKEINPFLFYSKQLQTLFTKAAVQKDPAMWL